MIYEKLDDDRYILIKLLFSLEECNIFVYKIFDTLEQVFYVLKYKLEDNTRAFKKFLENEIPIHEFFSRTSPNVIKFIKKVFFERDEKKYIGFIMEYAQYGDLTKCLKYALSENETRNIIHQLALAVENLHAMGYVHLDIKPENILVTDRIFENGNANLRVKLADFGHVTRIGKPLCLSTIGYYPLYSISQAPVAKPFIDVWCLTVLMYELTRLIRLYSRVSNEHLKQMIDKYIPPDINNSSEEFKELFLKNINSGDIKNIKKFFKEKWFIYK